MTTQRVRGKAPSGRYGSSADPNALSESEREDLERLRRKTAQQEIDLEIPRKAVAYLARETNR